MRTNGVRVGFVGMALLAYTNGPVFHVATRWFDGRLAWEEPVTRLTFLAVSVVGICLAGLDVAARRGSGSPVVSPATIAIGGFAGIALASSAWSIDPGLTVGRAFVYVGMAAWAWLLASPEVDLRAALVAMLAPAVGLSVVALALSDEVGRDMNGDWRGVYLNRNSLAPLCGLGLIVGVSLLVDARARRRSAMIPWSGALLAVASAVLFVGAGSRTAGFALATAVATTVLVGLSGRLRRSRPRFASAVIAVGSVVVLTAGSMAAERAWNESTLVQRRHIWSFAWERIRDRPVFGHGWFTVWATPEFVGDDPQLQLGNAHSSALDVLLGTGAVGLGLFLAIIGLAAAGVVRSAWRDPGISSLTALAVVVLLIVENLTESFVLMYSYNWVLLMAFAARSGIGWPKRRAERRPPPSVAAIG